MNNDENLDLLDLDDADASQVDDNLPDAAPFVAPRPHRPWLLLVIGLAIVVLAVFIIISVLRNNSSVSRDVDLDVPVVIEDSSAAVETPVAPVPPVSETQSVQVVQVQPAQVAPAVVQRPVVAETVQPAAATDSSVRVVQDRKEVKFNPEKTAAAPKPIVVPAKKTTKVTETPKPAAPAKKATTTVANGGWYVQFGSYGTRAAADAAEKKIRAEHPTLFNGKRFVTLAAVLPNGTTTYRLRIAFANSNDANGFCRNAKSDGLDCYVAK